MKNLFTLLAFVITLITNAQAPQGFNYQATVRNSTGAVIANQNVYFKFNVMLNSQTSIPVFTETHYVPTDDLGQVNLVIGQGTATTGSFSAINWGTGNYYLGIELNTGAGYVAMGTTQLLSVPYALYANTSGSTTGNSDGFTHYVGELFGGGIVVSVWKTAGVEHGLVASLTDLSGSISWTTQAFYNISVPNNGALSGIDGLANTNAIVAQAGATTNYAAGLCIAYTSGGFTDWYLPSTWELNQCYNAALIVNEVLGDTNCFQSNDYYWSSTVFYESEGYAWVQNLNIGTTKDRDKSYISSVRAVRRF